MSQDAPKPVDFIRQAVVDDNASGRFGQKVVTRFPPEPNGFLHIGHAKAIFVDFGVAKEFGGRCHLRMDDTNPIKEDQRYIDAIQADVRWLGFDWGPHFYYASDYFEQLYAWAVALVKAGKAYVCELTGEQVRLSRGNLTQPGANSPFRERPVAESLRLLDEMRAGKHADGSMTLRAKIDMASPNLNLRDPVMYRIIHASHPHVGDKWAIYPTYDYAHGQSDSIEGITHSICTLEFEAHRPLYDWFCQNLGIHNPRQIEFARLNLTHTVMSKRKLLKLVEDGVVDGWDDPRMPTLAGMRRRGYPPRAIREFSEGVGVAKRENMIEFARLEFHIREVLNKEAPRRMAVLDPLKITIENYPEGQVEWMDAVNNPEDPAAGSRKVPFSKTLYIEREDFMENPPKKFFRLAPGAEVRLRYGYWVKCVGVVKNAAGEVVEARCVYDPATRGGDNPPDGRKVKGTLHWVSAEHAIDVEVRLYEHLFTQENPENMPEGQTFMDCLNPHSLKVLPRCHVEPSLADVKPGKTVQFERLGYFCADASGRPGKPVFNRTATLKDTWAKVQHKE